MPLFPQTDADRVIAIISNPAAVEQFIPSHPKFGPMYLDYLEAWGPSIEEVKVRWPALYQPGPVAANRSPLTPFVCLTKQSNIKSILNQDHLLLTPSGAQVEPQNRHDRLVQHHLHTFAFLNAYIQEVEEPIEPLRASLGTYWGLLANTNLRPDDLWHAQLTHRILLWSSFSPSGSSIRHQNIGVLALVGLEHFLEKSLRDPLHRDAATRILYYLNCVPCALP